MRSYLYELVVRNVNQMEKRAWSEVCFEVPPRFAPDKYPKGYVLLFGGNQDGEAPRPLLALLRRAPSNFLRPVLGGMKADRSDQNIAGKCSPRSIKHVLITGL